MYQPDETIRLEVRVEDETVWLTQQQMAELFKATKQNISLHINNIYDEGELEQPLFWCHSHHLLFAYIKMQETPAAHLLKDIM